MEPPRFTAKDVVDDWWLSGGCKCSVEDHFKLEVIASTLLAVPRLLEYAKEYIDVNMLDSNEIRLSKESIQGLYS